LKATKEKPPIEVSFGTNFILGADFPMDTTLEQVTPDIYAWHFSASQGAKNLSDAQDWKNTLYVGLKDSSKHVTVLTSYIDFKPKKK
jgi:hypothetical protein